MQIDSSQLLIGSEDMLCEYWRFCVVYTDTVLLNQSQNMSMDFCRGKLVTSGQKRWRVVFWACF